MFLAIHQMLCFDFQKACERDSDHEDDIFEDRRLSPYNRVFTQLFSAFASQVCTICTPFTSNPEEIQYITIARWPGFVKPVLDHFGQQLDEYQAVIDVAGHDEMIVDVEPPELQAPAEDVRMRLLKLFTPSISSALEVLYPRQLDAVTWSLANAPPDNLLSTPFFEAQATMSMRPPVGLVTLAQLPRMSKFILIASYIASTNPQRTDIRMFGRGLDEKKRKRKVNKPVGSTGAAAKVGAHPQCARQHLTISRSVLTSKGPPLFLSIV